MKRKKVKKKLLMTVAAMLIAAGAHAQATSSPKEVNPSAENDQNSSVDKESSSTGSTTTTDNNTTAGPSASAEAELKKSAKLDTAAKAVMLKDVETLMDKVSQYDNKKVSVPGEVERSIDNMSFLLDSGGIINDEIVVIKGPNISETKFKQAKEDKDMQVTGTVRTIPIIEVRRELSWDLDPQVESELQGVQAFLVAEDIKPAAKR